jgi:hypothetical protein
MPFRMPFRRPFRNAIPQCHSAFYIHRQDLALIQLVNKVTELETPPKPEVSKPEVSKPETQHLI